MPISVTMSLAVPSLSWTRPPRGVEIALLNISHGGNTRADRAICVEHANGRSRLSECLLRTAHYSTRFGSAVFRFVGVGGRQSRSHFVDPFRSIGIGHFDTVNSSFAEMANNFVNSTIRKTHHKMECGMFLRRLGLLADKASLYRTPKYATPYWCSTKLMSHIRTVHANRMSRCGRA